MLLIFFDQIIILFYFIYLFLAAPRGMWDLSSPTRDGTQAACSGSTESYLLDHQGSP